jgi:ABC-2 type transport system ATP-binding protein
VDRGTDVLLTTQYLDEADHLANRIVIIDHGQAVAAGNPAELKQRAGKSVIEVHVRDREDLTRVAAILARLDHGAPQVEESTRRVSVAVEAGPGSLRDALQALDAADAVVDDLSLRPPTLDEVFLALTGAPLDAVGSDPMPRAATAPPAA